MKINMYGLGYVGCVSAACLASEGHEVAGIDVDRIKVDAINGGKSPIVEPGLGELIQKTVAAGRLRAETRASGPADVSFVAVGTPSNENGSLQLTYIRRVAEDIGEQLRRTDAYHVVNVRSTVLPGTVEGLMVPLMEQRSGKRAGKDFGVCMNPEFMRESTSIHDYYHPPFTVIGEIDARSGETIAALYAHLDAPLSRTAIRTAEMIKYACNAFHALKVTFANEIGNVCKQLRIDSHAVMDVFCQDTKLNLSPWYLKPGFAFGGSCLPKDVRALLYKSRELDLDLPVLGAVLRSNEHQIETAYRLVARAGKKKVGLLGLSFKPETDDLRESPMVALAEKLLGKGFELRIYDKEVSLARIFGSNKQYIEELIPHVSSLMQATAAEVIDASEVIVVAKGSAEYNELLARLDGAKTVVDLARVAALAARGGERYDGLCW